MRKRIALLSLAITALAATVSIHSAGLAPADIVKRALEKVDWNPGRSWAYTQTGFEDETLVVSRFDPSRSEGERWTLLSIDNRPPSVEELEEFAENKQYDQALPDNDSDVPDMIEFESLTLAHEDRNNWTFSFQPILDGDEAIFADRMNGEIVVSKTDGTLQHLEMRNDKSIRPAIGVKIKTMHMRFDFGPAADNGPQVIREITVNIKGGAYLLVSFNEQESTRYSDFAYVGDSVAGNTGDPDRSGETSDSVATPQ